MCLVIEAFVIIDCAALQALILLNVFTNFLYHVCAASQALQGRHIPAQVVRPGLRMTL